MKSVLLVVLLFLLSYPVRPQIIKKDGEYTGIDKFVLGESKAKFTGNITLASTYKKNNHEFTAYYYSPLPNETIEIANTRFNYILMTFDDSDRLCELSVIKFYKKADIPHYEKEAEKDFKKITAYLAEQLNQKGESKMYYKHPKSVFKGQEWLGTKTFLKVRKSYSAYTSSIEIYFSFRD
ncbi:MAG: hypothetical protein Q8941_13655 [Bacteroidota bacterium]|nr:hypothetical protein [Bacteroidota bacterium]